MKGEDNDTYAFYGFYEELQMTMFEIVLQRLESFFITPLGILGNILIVITLTQKKNRRYATSVILISLAVSDTFILLSGLYNFLIRTEERSSVECKISTFMGYTSVQASSLLLVAVALERVLGVTMPHRVKSIFTTRNARWLIIFIVSFLCTMNICILVSHDVYMLSDDLGTGCDPVGELKYFMYEVYPWIDFSIAFAIPFAIIAFTSVVIVVQIKKISTRAGSGENARIYSVTRTLLAANVAFLICMGPFGVYQVFYPIPPFDITKYSLWIGFLTLSQANAAANFFLYFLAGQKFRTDVKELFMCCIPAQTQSRPQQQLGQKQQACGSDSNPNIKISSSPTDSTQVKG